MSNIDSNKLYEIYEKMSNKMGEHQLLESLIRGMSSNELQENLSYINEVHNLGIEELEE